MRMQMMKNLHLAKLAALLIVISVLSACSLPKRPALEITSWMVAPERTGTPYKPRSDLWLKMGSSSTTPPFDGKSFVYRLGDQRYEKDFYNTYSLYLMRWSVTRHVSGSIMPKSSL